MNVQTILRPMVMIAIKATEKAIRDYKNGKR